MQKEIENLTYILEEEKIKQDYINLKNNSKIKIKVTHYNGYEYYDYFTSKNSQFLSEVKRLEKCKKNNLIKFFKIIE